jgi:queuosine precursor transporter
MPDPLEGAGETDGDVRVRYLGLAALAAYAATIPAANWMIQNVGTACIPDGPCLIPVGFGLTAPSGVLMIGAALVLRDAVHRLLGWQWAVGAILFGAMAAATFSPPALVAASVAAFLLSELADFAVYAPLARRRLVLAVLASGVVGAIIDSAVFLWLAFGSLDFIAGQVVGKLMVTVAAAALLYAYRLRTREAPP